MKELIGFRTITRGDETVRIPIYKKTGSKDYIQKSIKHPGRVREIIQRWYGKDGFDDKGRIKPEYLIKAKQKAKEEHNRSLEDAIDLAIRLKKMDKTKPYGVSRELAAEEVQALRDKGQKARLIETNRKKDLYAPYEGVLPVDQVNGVKPEEEPDKEISEPQAIDKAQEATITPIDVRTTFQISAYADRITEDKYESKPLIDKYDFGPVFVKEDHVEIANARTEKQKEMAQKIIDDINNKYGTNYSLELGQRYGDMMNKYGRMYYALKPPREKAIHYGQSHPIKPKEKKLGKTKIELQEEGRGAYIAKITGPSKTYKYERVFLPVISGVRDNGTKSIYYEGELPYGTIVDTSSATYMVVPKTKQYPKGLKKMGGINNIENLKKNYKLLEARKKAGYDNYIA